MVVLFCGVASRYLLHNPLFWSDELASILFLWLAMLGSVVAIRRAEHMRMTAIVGTCSPRVRTFLDIVALVVVTGFFVLMIGPSIDFTSDEAFVTTPALSLTNAWSAAALPVGFGLMLVMALIRMIDYAEFRLALAAIAIGVAICGFAIWAEPVLRTLGNCAPMCGRCRSNAHQRSRDVLRDRFLAPSSARCARIVAHVAAGTGPPP
jgi:TRAP-type C4-dicarboxylate transport system permease small subunit